ncbi:Nif3-like dinuclear metal center hexameric protein [Alicyclobacillus ferrooxydans]|uniref:GTP cyclohydrolase 1 type 2 homolog n=1 Tax=Alicyclobacillus ferrooxydans TaxID=471514 RepID=A0A0P9C7E1_9BACL|nr:Nif3-like dinuclear metal center hexameric protein [Alicyclobacillus ferrooxydans]KPV40842.1 transcriptional regulator [Alicyclobacillus ferrooxydans]
MTVTIQDVLDKLLQPVRGLPLKVDRLISGQADASVTGIVTTFMATNNVISKSAACGANLIITHEGPFYNHLGQIDLLQDNGVYLEKQKLIEESGVAIFRFHDGIHRYQPDGIMTGLLRSLGWEQYVNQHRMAATTLTIPTMTFWQVVQALKEKLRVPFLRAAGDLSMKCSRVGLLVGYRGSGELTIPLFEKEDVDLIIAGEGPEWEAPEYVRDAVNQGQQKGLIMLGHQQSEEPGMRYLADTLSRMFPDVPVYFLGDSPCFHVV